MTNGEKLRELLAENFPELATTKGVELRSADNMDVCSLVCCSDMPNCNTCRKYIGEDWQDREYVNPEERKKKKFKTRGDKFIEAIKEAFPQLKDEPISIGEDASICEVFHCGGVDCNNCPFDSDDSWSQEETDELLEPEEPEDNEKKQKKNGDGLTW